MSSRLEFEQLEDRLSPSTVTSLSNDLGLPEGVEIIDFYDDKYKDFISDKNNYTDIGHFSKVGGEKFYKNLLLPFIQK